MIDLEQTVIDGIIDATLTAALHMSDSMEIDRDEMLIGFHDSILHIIALRMYDATGAGADVIRASIHGHIKKHVLINLEDALKTHSADLAKDRKKSGKELH